MLTYGHLPKFGRDDALVLLGDRAGVQVLSRLLRELANEDSRTRVVLDDADLFDRRMNTTAVIEIGESESSAEPKPETNGRLNVIWTLSRRNAGECADMLDVLATTNGSGHQYLENCGDIQIIVSVEEYELRLFDAD
jgi:hypothetical protein